MKALLLPLLLIVTFSFCSAQRIFRSPADSAKYFQLQQEIATAIRDNNELAVENLVTKAESYIVKVIPMYEEGQYTLYKDLLKTDRPDTIKRLGLYALNLRKLPEKIYQCTNLQELDIAACKIKRIPEELNQLQSLERITIAKSNLKKVRIGIKENYTVKEINLAFNNIRKISPGIANFKNLAALDISSNNIKKINNSLNNLAHLIYLDVGFNKVSKIHIKLEIQHKHPEPGAGA